MGRPLRYPSHPVARLRKALSTPNREMTREDLARKMKVSASAIRDIEMGRYELSMDLLRKLFAVTAVRWESLLRGDDPILDVAGDPLTPKSIKWLQDQELINECLKQDEILLAAFLRAAIKKKCGWIVSESLRSWMKETALAFDLDDAVSEELLIAIDGSWAGIPQCFFPKEFRPISETQPRSRARRPAGSTKKPAHRPR